jgi:hypothetical protein
MNAQQIRSAEFESDNGEWESAKWLQEQAAQLAEQTELQRQALEIAQKNYDLYEKDSQRKNLQIDQLTAAQTVLSDSIAKSSQPTPMPVRILPDDPDQPQHLGCIVRMPDGSHSVVNNAGQFSPLEPDQANMILANLQSTDSERNPN